MLQDEEAGVGANLQMARNVFLNAGVTREMERFANVNFYKTRLSIGGGADTSRRIGFGAFYNAGDEIRFVADPFLGRGRSITAFTSLRPFSRLQGQLEMSTSALVDPRRSTEVFNVKLYRAQTTFQFTNRLLARSIAEFNTFAGTLGTNVLLTYRVNAGTVFYDRYQGGLMISSALFSTREYQRTNRAIFTKLQYLFRY